MQDQNGSQAMNQDPDVITLQQYVSDMLALETHIEEAIDGQMAVLREHPGASAAMDRFHSMVRMQREAMRMHLTTLGGAPNTGMMGMGQSLIKTAVSTAFGMAAGAINTLRTQAVSKALRDDYTAFSHAAVSYAMLLSTAELLDHSPTTEIAGRHLKGYENAIEEIAGLVPEVVAWELRRDGRIFDDRRVGSAAQTLSRAWRVSADDGGGSRRAA